jgi:hypothetical protein
VGKLNKYQRRLLKLAVLIIGAFLMTLGGRALAHHEAKKQTIIKPEDVVWSYNAGQGRWLPNATPPVCAKFSFSRSPVDMRLVTAAFYPGQYRGGSYSANAGFNFDDSANHDIQIHLPFNAKLAKLAFYVDNGDDQYKLFFINPCGLAIEFDHLLTLSHKYQTIVKRLRPTPTIDSRSVPVQPAVKAEAGDLIATAVGQPSQRSVNVDIGFYDLRAPNQISSNTVWTYYHQTFKSSEWFGTCWFDKLPKDDLTSLRTILVSSPSAGGLSDYCQLPAAPAI